MEEALLPEALRVASSGPGSGELRPIALHRVLVELGAGRALLVSHPPTQPKQRELEVLAITHTLSHFLVAFVSV